MDILLAKVVSAYESRAEEGLSLSVGDTVEILDTEDEYWWKGLCRGKVGLFPKDRVELLKRERTTMRALYTFEAREADELGFVAGDLIEVIARSKSGWWKGKIGERVGLFPANRTEPVEDGAKPKLKKKVNSSEGVVTSSEQQSQELKVRPQHPPPPSKPPKRVSEPSLTKGKLFEAFASFRKEDKDSGGKSPDAEGAGSRKRGILGKSESKLKRDSTETPELGGSRKKGILAKSDDKSKLKLEGGEMPELGGSRKKGLVNMLSKIKGKTSKSESGKNTEEMTIEHPFEAPKQDGMESEIATEPAADPFTLLDQNFEATSKRVVSSPEDPKAAQLKRHGYILLELIDTEEDYVKDMEMIVELFLVPLRITNAITKTEADNVFQNLPHLIPISRELLEKLKSQLKLSVEEQSVGSIFLTFLTDSIKEYMQYASQSILSGKTLSELSKNSKWTAFLEDTYPNPLLRDLKLDTYLIKPVQRVCRYPLLLKELQRATPPGCPDSASLLQAIDRLTEIIGKINDTRKESENLHHMVQVENNMKNRPADLKFLPPNRWFVQEALMEVVKKNKHHPRIVWLFSDCVVYGKILPRSKYKFEGVVYFKTSLMQDIKNSEEIEHAFELISVDQKKSLVLCCSSDVQKQEWARAISDKINSNLEQESREHKKNLKVGVNFDAPTKAEEVVATAEEAKDDEKPQESSAIDQFPPQIFRKTSSFASPMKVGYGKSSVRVKGPQRSARVLQLKFEMINQNTGVEKASHHDPNVKGLMFSGKAAVMWCMQRFRLETREPALELMIGLLRAGIIVPVLDTPTDEGQFLDLFTAYYAFVD